MDSDDIYLLLHATSCMRTFIAVSYEEVKALNLTERIIDLAKKMLKPETNESTALFLGNFVI